MHTRTIITFIVSFIIISLSFLSLSANDQDLLGQARKIFGSLPEVMPAEKNPITPEKVKLGKILFYETRISIDGTVSCARCHPIGLYGADGLKKSIGNNCKINPRNAPTIFNAAAQIAAHWIGNRTGVEDQARQSVIGPAAFGMPSYEAVEKRLIQLGYTNLFKAAFHGVRNPVTVDNFAQALGCFERTLVTPAPFDAYIKGDTRALTEPQKRGLKTFIQIGCGSCHSGAYFGGQTYQKFGVSEPYWKYTKSAAIDAGRFEVTKQESDKYVFKIPVLRNIEKTPPYFHDGSVDDLARAVWIMGKTQTDAALTDSQVKELVSFLKSLTGVISEQVLIIPLLP
jgi:cytochrome c peroxidase